MRILDGKRVTGLTDLPACRIMVLEILVAHEIKVHQSAGRSAQYASIEPASLQAQLYPFLYCFIAHKFMADLCSPLLCLMEVTLINCLPACL